MTQRPSPAAGSFSTFRRMPEGVRAAGAIWIVIGSLIVFTVLVTGLLFGGPLLSGLQLPDGRRAVGILLIRLLAGIAFVRAGIRSCRGTAAPSPAGGIGSLLFGVLHCAWAVYLIAITLRTDLPDTDRSLSLPLDSLIFLSGLGLLAAGVLALQSSREYRAWKQIVRVGPRR